MAGLGRILVTGGTGFIGDFAVRALVARGYDVAVAARTPVPTPGAELVAVDLLDQSAHRGLLEAVRPDTILHLAWNVAPGRFWRSPDNLDWVAATVSLFRAFAEVGGRRFVGAGTCAEYDWTSVGPLDPASTPIRPATFYGVAKAAVHDVLAGAADVTGVEVGWGRLFFLYGPGEKPGRLVSDVARSLLAGRPVDVGTGEERRDFMHVADVAEAFVRLVEAEGGRTVNIASGACPQMREIVSTIARTIGREELVNWGARQPRPGEPPRIEADVAALSEIGFRPRFTLEAGLADTIDWWRGRSASDPGGA